MLTPNNNRGITYQTDEKHLINFREYLVGAVKLACYLLLKTRLLLRVFNDNLLKYFKIATSKKTHKMLRL